MPSSLRFLKRARAAKMYQLPGKPQPSIERMPIKDQWITKKAGWDLFAEKLRNSPDLDQSTNL